MSWGTRRRNTIIAIFILIIAIPSSIILFNIYYEPANCFDGKQNGDEQEVDCGGSCELLCQELIIEPTVLWRRFFQVSPGIYNVVAMIENQNPNAGVPNAQYVFKLYDNNNVLLYERKGSVELKPKEVLPIIENTLFTNKLSASRVSFEFTNEFIYERDVPRDQVLVIKDERLTETESTPRIDAMIQNIDLRPVEDITVVVVVYDNDGNAMAVSSTVIDFLEKDQQQPAVFTWPQPFESEVASIEIIPLYDNN